MPFHATRNGFDGRKCHFMRHETAPTVGNAISCDTTRPKRPLRVTRNEQKEVRGHFGSPEMSKKWFAAISGRQKQPKRGFRSFRATRNEQKVVRGHFGPPETTKKWFAAISGHQTRLRRGVCVMPHDAHDAFRPRRASRSGGACRRTSSRRQRLRPAAFRRIGAGSRPACGAVGGHCRAS